MTDDLRDRVERYLENHPDADRWEILGQLGLDPSHQDIVDDVLEEDSTDNDEPVIVDSIPARNYNETCANPHCNEPRVNPHPDSLCEKHHPGDPNSGSDGQRKLDENLSENQSEDVHEPTDNPDDDADCDLVAEAESIAGYEPESRPQPSGSKPDEGAADNESDVDVEELTAADFMGGDSPVASDTRPDQSPSTTSTTDANYARPTSTLPIAQLDAIEPGERRRAARKRGLTWPSTEEARDELFDTIADVIRHEDDRIIDAPTSLGKSYTIASTRWGAREDLTGGKPVIHLSETRDARDEAIEAAEADGGEYFVLKSRHEACPVAAGDHDPCEDDETNDRVTLTIDGQPASEWIQEMCDGRGLPFSAVHRYLEEHNDQCEKLPCCHGSSGGYDHAEGEFEDDEPAECPAIRQWDDWREGDYALTLATHNFAHVPGIRTATNLVIDEEPSFEQDDLTTDRVRSAVAAYLREIDAPIQTWESFIQTSRYEGYGDDAFQEREVLEDALSTEPDREWYFKNPDAHTLAPALARAIFHAEARPNDRRVGKTPYEPPRLDATARDDDGWNREWVSVVLDESNDVQTVRVVPDLSQARSVVGLDAHPAKPVWQANTLPWIDTVDVLEPEERQLWRRYERGLRVVQVGDATRPLASGEYFDDRGTRALVEHLHDEYGHRFRTGLTAKSVKNRLQDIMNDVGLIEPELMHYGEEKSRNDFADEPVGLVNGCIDPGDDYVVNLLAELDLEAEPERSDTECDHCEGDGCHDCGGSGHKRAHGRAFVGDDAAAAAEILSAVRENHTAQAAGRYARNPDDPDSTATVFVRTDAMPPGFADVQIPGVEWVYTDKQKRVVEALRDRPGSATAHELAQEADVSKRHVHRTLERLVDHGAVDAIEGIGPNGATLYSDNGTPNAGVVDVTNEDGEVATDLVWGSYTWSVSIQEVDRDEYDSEAQSASSDTPDEGLYRWVGPPDGGG